MKKSHARIASAWERRNCGQVGPVRRARGIDAADPEDLPPGGRCDLYAESGQLAVDPANPQLGLSRVSRRTRALMCLRVVGRPVLPRMGRGAPAATDDVPVPKQPCWPEPRTRFSARTPGRLPRPDQARSNGVIELQRLHHLHEDHNVRRVLGSVVTSHVTGSVRLAGASSRGAPRQMWNTLRSDVAAAASPSRGSPSISSVARSNP